MIHFKHVYCEHPGKESYKGQKNLKDLGVFDKTQADFPLHFIKGFIYGATSSRFWMFRKFINNYNFEKDNKEIPILNWQCLTIRFKDYYEDLIIEDEG
jgi:hypothetical protein